MPRFMYLFILGVLLLVSCGQTATPSSNTPAPASSVVPVFAFSEAVVGPNRIALGILNNGTPLNDPNVKVHLSFFNLDEQSPEVKFETDAHYFGQGLPLGFYVAYPTFDKPGNWGIDVQTQLPGQSAPSSAKMRLEVKAESTMPNVGQPAKKIKTPTIADTPEEQLSSGQPINPAMYQISLDDAIDSGKPTAVLFGTPAFCSTATCGPSLNVLGELQKTYGDRMNFVHIEVYKYPFSESAGTGTLSEPMLSWGLRTEPWLFLIDSKGIIAARYEGGITTEEISPALDKLIAGEAIVFGS
jgi:hypothetical protein